MASESGGGGSQPRIELLRAVIEELAVLPRLPASAGERRAAVRIAERLTALGVPAQLEPEAAYRSYALPIGLLSAAAVGCALIAGRGAERARGRSAGRTTRRLLAYRLAGAVGAGLATAGIADDINGPWSACRRLFLRRGTTHNVLGVIGDRQAPRTLCVLAHHDAAPSGVVFSQVVQEWMADHLPEVVDRMRSNPPLWWPVLAGPVLISAGALSGRSWLRRSGLLLSLGALAAMLDIGRRPAVPGANDNLSGVAALLELARLFTARPVPGLRIWLISAGAEEALQEGIRAFAARHFGALDPARTWFVTLDTIGSGRLVLLEGEGPLRVHDYDPAWKDEVAATAARLGVPLIRGLRSRSSTDGVVASKHGFPTATLVSVDRRKLIPHYHLPSDRPEHVDYGCVAAAVRVVDALARGLGRDDSS